MTSTPDSPATTRAARSKLGCCDLCGRRTALTFHHLIPRKLHRRKRYRKRFDRDTLNRGIAICRRCHAGLHRLYDEATLAEHFDSIEALRADPAVRRHTAWVRRQKS